MEGTTKAKSLKLEVLFFDNWDFLIAIEIIGDTELQNVSPEYLCILWQTGEQTTEVLDLSVRSLSLDVTGINMFGAIIKHYFTICKNIALVFAFQSKCKSKSSFFTRSIPWWMRKMLEVRVTIWVERIFLAMSFSFNSDQLRLTVVYKSQNFTACICLQSNKEWTQSQNININPLTSAGNGQWITFVEGRRERVNILCYYFVIWP